MQKRTLYIGNLAYTAVEEDLEQAFESFGVIEDIKLMRDRETGRSRGFAFITFEKETEAEAARTMDGKEVAGRPLRVNGARQKESGQRDSAKRQPRSFNNNFNR
ncbi:RNA-binding protein [Thalassotalea sp. G20_0]|uniref:RNA recognition motif domain-containing protein n=1 Tax=Thalassotalea sp. G20_0 TaxID=2821093 RepID=UPI001ADC7006|nr:RNA-binding protein [Thalassotalea sp. G20_0]MBO9496867.1 RNA-binding protein [Thalassotalea sp. G20_0]